MITPKDYEQRRSPTPVEDHVAENRIKWSVVAQSVIIAAIVGLGSFAIRSGEKFGDNVLNKFDQVNNILMEMNNKMSKINTDNKINSIRLDKHDERFEHIETEIRGNTKAINDYFGYRSREK